MRRSLPLSESDVHAFCARWKVVEFSVFGSVLREDFGPDSDVDVLVRFAPDARWSLFDLVEMEQELARAAGRPVDVVDADTLRNPFRRHAILSTREVLHAA